MEFPILLVASIAIGGGLGYFLDSRFHTSPVFTLILGLLGFAAGMIQLVRRLSKDTRAMADSDSFYRAAERRIEWLTLACWDWRGAVFAAAPLGLARRSGRGTGRAADVAEFPMAEAGSRRPGDGFDRAGGLGTRARAAERVREVLWALRVAAGGGLCYSFAIHCCLWQRSWQGYSRWWRPSCSS